MQNKVRNKERSKEPAKELNVVTGAFGFTGKYITKLLLEHGIRMRTLTGHPDRPDPFDGRVEVRPFNFDDPSAMVESLRGASTVYNTYWVRFNHGRTTFGQAVANVQNLIRAAAEAEVKRFVHVSITNPDEDSTSGYLRGKALMERTLKESGLSYAIVRPTVLFGREDILFNNIAWLLRRFPAFAIPGTGDFRLQPVFGEDVARLAVELAGKEENVVRDAVGPETYSFKELVYLIRKRVKSRALLFSCPPRLAQLLTTMLNPIVGDVILTRDEVDKLGTDTLVSFGPPTCPTRFSAWLEENADWYGVHYASEIKRHFS
ncbi:MAG: NAD(P)H-binding protein [Thermodesulfobacteriota bacterium]